MSPFLEPAVALAHRVGETASGRRFRHSVHDFTRLLGSLPESPPDATTGADVTARRAIAQTVIEHIERRLEARTDRRATQVTMAQAVYQIQQALEHIDQWHRHQSIPTSSPS